MCDELPSQDLSLCRSRTFVFFLVLPLLRLTHIRKCPSLHFVPIPPLLTPAASTPTAAATRATPSPSSTTAALGLFAGLVLGLRGVINQQGVEG